MLLCSTQQVAATWQPLARHITMQDGLPSNVVYDVYEDSKGFIWFCTDQGVSRYDGSVFHNYSIKDGVPDIMVFRIREDQQQRMWLICYNQKACYVQHGKVYNSANDELCRRVEAEDIAYDEMFTDRDGNSCLAGKKIGILSAKPPYLRIMDGVTLPKGPLRHFRDQHGEDHIAVAAGVYNINSGAYYPLYISEGYIGISFYDGHSVFTTGVGAPDHPQMLDQWQLESGRFRMVKRHPMPARVYEIGPMKGNNIILSTAGGMLLFDPSSGKVIPDTTFPSGLQVNRMRTDREGNRWLSTLKDGVYFMSAGGGRMIDQRSGLNWSNILSVGLGKTGDIFAGDDAGHVYRIRQDKVQTYTLHTPHGNNRVLFIKENIKGELLVGSDVGLYRIDPDNKVHFLTVDAYKAGAASGNLFYAGSAATLTIYDRNTGKLIKNYGHRTTAVAVDQQGMLWTGGIKEVHYYKDGKRTLYTRDSLLTDCFISNITPAPGGGVLIGSNTLGLFIVKDPRLPARRLNTDNGLSSNNCKKVFIARDGYIWIASDAGIDRLQLFPDGNFRIRRFSLPQGIAGNRINDMVENDGRLFVATGHGILVLNSRDTQQYQPPRLYIETVNGNALTGQPLRFAYKDRNLQATYAGLSYNGGTPLQYKYILSGGTDDTLYTQTQSIDFTALSSGAYELLLWCRSPGSPWTAQPVRLAFTIQPPFWRHPLVIVLALLLAASVLALLFRLRIRKVKKRVAQQARNQQQLAELEMNALRAQINPHFIFNALNAIQFYYSQNDEITANHYMTSFAHFIRLTLTYSQAHWLPLSEEVAMLRTYSELEQIRYQQLFTVTFDIEPGLIADRVAIPAMMIQPYVENAINHGLRYLKNRKGRLTVSFSIKDNTLCCIVDDNGIGRKQAATYKQAQHTSMGMKITHQRIEAINRMYGITVRMEITDNPDTPEGPGGTRVSLYIPLKLTDHDLKHPDR